MQTVSVGFGNNNTIAYSTNGTQWTGLGSTIFTNSGNCISYASNINLWIVGGDGTNNTLAYSSNGTIWTGLGTTIFNNTPKFFLN